MHTYEDILWKQFRKEKNRIIRIRQFRECSTAINCSSTKELTGSKNFLINRFTIAPKGPETCDRGFFVMAEKQTPIKGSRLAKAVTYVLNQRPYMMTYLEDGRCSLSNQISENAIRSVTVGRKNWLFCDFTDGADASMAVYTLLETARANGLNPLKYLEFLLNARPNDKMPDEALEKLTLWSNTVQECCINKSEQNA